MKTSKNKIATLLIIAAIAVPMAAAVFSQGSEGADGFVSYYDQLDANGKAIFDALNSAGPDDISVDVDLPIALTAKADVKEDAEKYVYDLVTATVNKAFIALRMSVPQAYLGWILSSSTAEWTAEMTTVDNTATIKKVKVPIDFLSYPVDPNTGEFQGINKMQDDLDAAIAKFNTNSKSTRGKVMDINNYLTKLVTYDPNKGIAGKESGYAHDAYGALVDPKHYAVCDGYSKAFLLLCEKEGIECVIVLGTAVPSMEYHAWNYVKMDNGKWYAIDVTWNDTNDNAYFLLGGESFFTTHQQGVYLSSGSISSFPFNTPAINKTGYDANDDGNTKLYSAILAAAIVGIICLVLYRYAKKGG
ncbi:MAG: hypothetical protein FWC29_04110 [Methanomassiliicoccaceae archaeon]|nr:hypothetical protein [Methanomassiliicoccaceae archaeon]